MTEIIATLAPRVSEDITTQRMQDNELEQI